MPSNVWTVGEWGGWTPNCFLNPPNTLSNYVLEGGRLYTIYIRFTSQFWSDSSRRKVQPPVNFSQFNHWCPVCMALITRPITSGQLQEIERLLKRSVWIAGRVEPPTVFSTPLTHCQIMYWGSAIYYIHTIYIIISVGLLRSKCSTP